MREWRRNWYNREVWTGERKSKDNLTFVVFQEWSSVRLRSRSEELEDSDVFVLDLFEEKGYLMVGVDKVILLCFTWFYGSLWPCLWFLGPLTWHDIDITDTEFPSPSA